MGGAKGEGRTSTLSYCTRARMQAVWPDPLLCGGVLVAALLLLSGDLAWSQGGKDKKYIEDLTWMQLWWVQALWRRQHDIRDGLADATAGWLCRGLWGIECQSYNMWFMLAIIAVRGVKPAHCLHAHSVLALLGSQQSAG